VKHLEWLRAKFSVPVHVLGHSLGGQLSVAGISRWHQPGAKVIVVGSGTVHFQAWSGLEKWRILFSTQFASTLARVLGYFPGDKLGFGGVQGKRLIVDWAHASRTGTFRLEHGLEQFSPEVLAIHVKGDTYAPRASTERLVRKLVNAQVTWADVEPPAEPKRQDPHFRWMKDPRAVAETAARFLTAT
jgi:predicted alpha/beta hydrolase